MRRLLVIVALLAPHAALAATATAFDFTAPSYGRWEVQGWNGVRKTAQGIVVQTTQEGAMLTTLPAPSGAHTLSVRASAAAPVEMLFVWEAADGSGMVQLPVPLPRTAAPAEQRVDLTKYPQWNPRALRIGIALPERASVTLEGLSLIRYSPTERAEAALRSLARFDTFQAFSINFLWGPLIAFTPDELARLYEGQPPSSWSAMRFLYAGMALCVAALRLLRKPLGAALGMTAVVAWLLLDARMGAELLSYAARDWSTYLSKPAAERTLRDREHLYATVDAVLPALQGDPAYALVSPWRITGLVRYLTYPSLPLDPAAAGDARLWLVFEDPTAAVDAEGRLTREGAALTAPGRVLQRFGEHTFLFSAP